MPRRCRPLAARAGIAALAFALAAACASHPQPRPPAQPAATDVADELRLARAGRAAGQLDVARDHLQRAVDADATLFEPRLDLAEILLAEGADLDRAARVLRDAWRLGRGDVRLARLRGSLRDQSGDLAGAVDVYGAALAIEPDTDLRLRRGLLLVRLARRSEAIAELEQVRGERPDDRSARVALAELYEAGGQLSRAEGELATLADLPPHDGAAQRRLARFLWRHGAAERAQAADRRARDLEGPLRNGRVLRPLQPAKR